MLSPGAVCLQFLADFHPSPCACCWATDESWARCRWKHAIGPAVTAINAAGPLIPTPLPYAREGSGGLIKRTSIVRMLLRQLRQWGRLRMMATSSKRDSAGAARPRQRGLRSSSLLPSLPGGLYSSSTHFCSSDAQLARAYHSSTRETPGRTSQEP
ncbi:hypothetical protein NDU88_006384 [Pleurodeles waltl]|uniref:Uncharacterized protein n=1 Tax=Pleurodeles waltl TaxID=8319 RepID=A0AAV7WXF6_PLEWA|nr:hypothetical protein NDU88_006384 [Pleurodeles waltl]